MGGGGSAQVGGGRGRPRRVRRVEQAQVREDLTHHGRVLHRDDEPQPTASVLIHFGTESNGNSSYLLDMTPESGSSIYYDWRDPALVVGQSFHDPEAGVTLTAESVTGTGSAVTVRFEAAVSISTDRSSYTRNQSVSVKATVRSGGSPVRNANVTFTITKSNGAIVKGTATTGTDGAATYKLRLRRDDPVGRYQAGALAPSSGASGVATSFTVW